MSKIKVSELKCFCQVADVIGKARAEIELFKVLSASKECFFENEGCLTDAFYWDCTPQGGEFWNCIDEGINPYDN